MPLISRLRFKFSLEQTVLRKLAEICWGDLFLPEIVRKESLCEKHQDYICDGIKRLISYRDKVLSNVPETLNELSKAFPLPKMIIEKVINAVFNLFQGYYEAIKWGKRNEPYSYLLFPILNPFNYGKYEAGNYIDAEGHFNVIEWAKTFVADENQPIHTRFQFSCLYCLEEDIITLWDIMKSKNQLPYNGDLELILTEYDLLIAFWVYHLEGQTHTLSRSHSLPYPFSEGELDIGDIENDGLFAVVLWSSFSFGYEYAVKYFWNCCSEIEKTLFRDHVYTLIKIFKYADIDDFSDFSLNFMYTAQTQDLKQEMIRLYVEYNTSFITCYYSLHPRFYRSILEDILIFLITLPLEVCMKFINLLEREIMETPLPIYKSIYKQLSVHISNEQIINKKPVISRLRFKFSLELTVLRKLADICWGKFVLKEELITGDNSDLIRNLISYRDEVVSKVPEVLNELSKASSLPLTQKTIDKVINTVFSLFQGYYEAFIWERNFNNYLGFTILNPFTSGKYEAGNFIDANGYFNDVEWVKTFVADKMQCNLTRFKFSCMYCFEDDIITLWDIMKRKNQLPCKGDLDSMSILYNESDILIWAHLLEGQIHTLKLEGIIDDSLFVCALWDSFWNGCVHAAQYFWNCCSETEKSIFLSDKYYILDDYIDDCDNDFRLTFMYSIFSQEQKQDVIRRHVQMEPRSHLSPDYILYPRFYGLILDDILNFSLSLHLEVCESFLNLLDKEIRETPLPIYKNLYKQLSIYFSNEKKMGSNQ